ncbi:hypothetical protein SAMN04490244_101362 [Tranquillimonas rosea]|uniref:DUF1223 domain-containing protein n=1 Tax=Tranquillimonas rosea TaxID=641238 RepID=A0A1H9PW48_9RHOB|nr:DUF1223 domain-containing protein [Tranquillimonas rosea]SER52392.1 hypothetical protein SAMN04490244_101362 [Tranquillimonas rosea]
MRAIPAAGITLCLAMAPQVQAHDTDGQPVLVELYTSQGCASCPPADALLTELKGRSDVLPLALHVDYWDYIGWKDDFADPAYTKRQKGYAHAAGGSTVYTPQMVVGGQDHVVGYRPMELAELIEAHHDAQQPVVLTVSHDGGVLQIEATPRGDSVGDVIVQLVTFVPEREVSIKRGENAGKTITYTNVVTGWREVGRWDGAGTLAMTAQASGDEPAAVILQKPDYGPVVAAARAR